MKFIGILSLIDLSFIDDGNSGNGDDTKIIRLASRSNNLCPELVTLKSFTIPFLNIVKLTLGEPSCPLCFESIG